MNSIGVKRIQPRIFLSLVLLSIGCAWQAWAQTAPPAPAQTTPAAPAQTQTPQSAPQPAPAPKTPAKSESGYDTSDGQFSFRALYWYNPTKPVMATGHTAVLNTVANLNFGDKSKATPYVELSFPAGKLNSIRISAFRTQGSGNSTAPQIPPYDTYLIWGSTFSPGDPLVTNYTIENVKLSLDYLSWPFPLKNARFRVKTLWEVQYTNVKSSINAPFSPTQDASGNAIQTAGSGSNWFIWPSLGMGIEYMASKHFRFEAKGSGFALPHLPTLWDTEAFFAYRSGSFEVDFGGKAFHFKTSPRRDEYMRATMPGAYIGIRWYP